MDFLDFAKCGDYANALLNRFYIISTVTMSLVIVATIRRTKRVRDYPFPLTIVFFTAVNGIIFRAVSLSVITKWDNQRPHLLSDFDYARILFFTISNLALHLIPILTVHRWLNRKNQSLSDDGLAGIFSMICYFVTFVIFVLVICMMGIASTIPWNQDIMHAVLYNDTSSANLGLLPVFLHLMDASNMIYWWYTLSYIVILGKHYSHFDWSFLVFCILLIVTQIVLTISSFLPQLHGVYGGLIIALILQFIAETQFPTAGLMLATAKGASWVPPPADHFEDQEMQAIPNH